METASEATKPKRQYRTAVKPVDRIKPDPTRLAERLGFVTEPDLFALFGISADTGEHRRNENKFPPAFRVSKGVRLYKLVDVQSYIGRCRAKRIGEAA